MRKLAVLLCGWYLLMPPATGSSSSPYSWWRIMASFDSVKACLAEKGNLLDKAKDLQPTLTKPKEIAMGAQYLFWLNDSRCIATDDPRLAK